MLPMSKQRPVQLFVALAIPSQIPSQLIDGPEAFALDEALGQTERHRRVVRPSARTPPERPAAHHVGDGLECAWAPELEGRAQRVAGS